MPKNLSFRGGGGFGTEGIKRDAEIEDGESDAADDDEAEDATDAEADALWLNMWWGSFSGSAARMPKEEASGGLKAEEEEEGAPRWWLEGKDGEEEGWLWLRLEKSTEEKMSSSVRSSSAAAEDEDKSETKRLAAAGRNRVGLRMSIRVGSTRVVFPSSVGGMKKGGWTVEMKR